MVRRFCFYGKAFESMMRKQILKFFVWIVAVTLLCWCWVVYSFCSGFVGAAFLGLLAIFLPKGQRPGYRVSLSRVQIFIALLGLGLMILAAVSGVTWLSNKWFDESGLRLVVVALMWLLFVATGWFAVFRKCQNASKTG